MAREIATYYYVLDLFSRPSHGKMVLLRQQNEEQQMNFLLLQPEILLQQPNVLLIELNILLL